ncbi:MAG: vtpJ-therm [Myxococcales bacterium]|nr:pectinacetylesterase family protein [Deltaproteobacteria bacterium]NNL23028.1 vtpJ-therm [Myxococcales bacterium]
MEVWMRLNVLVLALAPLAALSGCGSDGATSTTGSGFEELYAQGLSKYVGAFEPANEPEVVEGVKTHQFGVPADPEAEPRGPLCLRGTEYTVDTREGGSEALVIFLQGGGACWEDFCAAFEETTPLPSSGILDPDLASNPVADWDVLYLPYCDGSLFAGDVDRVLPTSALVEGGPTESMGYQRGLQNLTAALDVGLAEFPNPSRILLTGVSGGAFGTIAALPLVRFYYPETAILVFNDSGVGVAKEGNPDFINETLIAGWNASSLVPESCPDCTSNGHATRLIEWQLAADDNFTMSALSFSADAVISFTFLMVTPANFTSWLLAETERTTNSFEDRYKRFIPSGTAHTTLLRETSEGGDGIQIGALDTEIAGVSVLDWLSAMIDGTEGWVDLVDEGLE